jgi:hypothetical protein
MQPKMIGYLIRPLLGGEKVDATRRDRRAAEPDSDGNATSPSLRWRRDANV